MTNRSSLVQETFTEGLSSIVSLSTAPRQSSHLGSWLAPRSTAVILSIPILDQAFCSFWTVSVTFRADTPTSRQRMTAQKIRAPGERSLAEASTNSAPSSLMRAGSQLTFRKYATKLIIYLVEYSTHQKLRRM